MTSRFVRPRRLLLAVVPAVLVVLLAGAATVAMTWRPTRVSATVTGVSDGAVLGAAGAARLRVTIAPGPGAHRDRVTVLLDGQPVRVERDRTTLSLRPRHLRDGKHELVVRLAGSGPFASSRSLRRQFTVDTEPPALRLPDRVAAGSLRDPVTITGTATGASVVTVDDVPAALHGDRFEATLPSPPATVTIAASDGAGNTARGEIPVHVRHPSMRGVHMTALAWTASSLREPVLRLARQGRIDAVELDIKDEDGLVGYRTKVPMARRVGAARDYYDPRQVIDQLHRMHVRVVGRIVAFRDPRLGRWAWRHGHRDWVIQTRGHTPYGGKYGAASFTNPFNAAVRDYNIALASEAATLGFDDVLYDYVRRPDGPLSRLRFAGRDGAPEVVIARFMHDTRAAVRAAGAFLGASVYGISATRPTQIAQDIPLIAKSADYIAPMVYPSHWGPGEYGVANPNRSPYPIVRRSLADFQRLVRGSDTRIMPWLQDFSLGVHYGPAQVRAQIGAARDAGIDSFLLWNAGARYTRAALPAHR